MGQFLSAPLYVALDINGRPISGAKMYGYRSGTDTAVTLYQDGDLSMPFSIPPESDDAGRFPNVYFDGDAATRIKLLDADDALIDDIDPVNDPASTGALTTYVDILFRCLGGTAPASGEVMDMFVADRALTFFANFDGTSQGFPAPRGKALGQPTAGDFVITVKKVGVTVGTLTVSQTAGAWAFATSGGASFSMDPDDWLTFEAQGSVDATFINSAWTLPAKVTS